MHNNPLFHAITFNPYNLMAAGRVTRSPCNGPLLKCDVSPIIYIHVHYIVCME